MHVVILAGGKGSRLGLAPGHPKAMARVGDTPIVCHIIDYYRRFGFEDFIIALGYGAEHIEAYFESHPLWQQRASIRLVWTGKSTDTGGRIKRLAPLLRKPFMLTWCDGVADIDLRALLEFHQSHGKMATVTAVHAPPRFGRLELESDQVIAFHEKKVFTDEWINGAYFVLEPDVMQWIAGDDTSWERGPLPALARHGELCAYRHEGFWQCMDTPAELSHLNALWRAGKAPWRIRTKDRAIVTTDPSPSPSGRVIS